MSIGDKKYRRRLNILSDCGAGRQCRWWWWGEPATPQETPIHRDDQADIAEDRAEDRGDRFDGLAGSRSGGFESKVRFNNNDIVIICDPLQQNQEQVLFYIN